MVSKTSVIAEWDDDDEVELLTGERRVLEQELINHLGDYHIVPILKWKMSVGLERKLRPGECFINNGEDYQNKTLEEEESFRLMSRRDKAMGTIPKKTLIESSD